MDMLAELQELQKRSMRIIQEDYKDSDYDFTTAEGAPQYPKNTYGWFKAYSCSYIIFYWRANRRRIQKIRTYQYKNHARNI